MNKEFEKFIKTYKNILLNKNRNKTEIHFFALNSLENTDIKIFSKKEKDIVNELKSYYKKPSSNKQHKLNDMILQYYVDKEEEEEVDDEEEDNDEIDDENNFEEVNRELKYPMEDIIELEKYSIEKLLSLYNITLETFLDSDIKTWTTEDQLNFSWPYKEKFLKDKLQKDGIFKCNTIVKVFMASVKDENKKIYPIFQTKYIIIRNPEDVGYFLRQSMVDIESRIGKFTKKMDQREATEPNQIHGSDCVDLGIEYEKMNIVKIQNVFANGYIELNPRIIHTKSCINKKNDDNKCFLYCHLLHERYRLNNWEKIQGAERLHGEKAYIYGDKMINLDYENIEFPIPFNTFYTVKKIEEQNQIRINIFEYKENKKTRYCTDIS